MRRSAGSRLPSKRHGRGIFSRGAEPGAGGKQLAKSQLLPARPQPSPVRRNSLITGHCTGGGIYRGSNPRPDPATEATVAPRTPRHTVSAARRAGQTWVNSIVSSRYPRKVNIPLRHSVRQLPKARDLRLVRRPYIPLPVRLSQPTAVGNKNGSIARKRYD